MEKQKKIIRELDEEGVERHWYEYSFWEKAAGKRINTPRELEYIVWFCLEMLKNEILTSEDTKGKILARSFEKACEKYPKIHRLWYREMLEIWVSKKIAKISYKERQNFDLFFRRILEGNMPPGYQPKDFIAFVAIESSKEDLLYYLQIYKEIWKEPLILDLHRQKDRVVCKKIFHMIEEKAYICKENVREYKLLECIGKVIWPKKCNQELLDAGAKSFGCCHDITLLQKARVCGLINDKEIDVYLEELIYQGSDLMVPFFLQIKYA